MNQLVAAPTTAEVLVHIQGLTEALNAISGHLASIHLSLLIFIAAWALIQIMRPLAETKKRERKNDKEVER